MDRKTKWRSQKMLHEIYFYLHVKCLYILVRSKQTDETVLQGEKKKLRIPQRMYANNASNGCRHQRERIRTFSVDNSKRVDFIKFIKVIFK